MLRQSANRDSNCLLEWGGIKVTLVKSGRSPILRTSPSCFLASNWFFEFEHPYIVYWFSTYRTTIRPWFETVCQQQTAPAQQRSCRFTAYTNSHTRVRRQAKLRKAPLAGCSSDYNQETSFFFLDDSPVKVNWKTLRSRNIRRTV